MVKKISNNKIILVCGLLFIISPLILLTRIFFLHRNWPTTNALVLSASRSGSGSGNVPIFLVEYSVNNKSYTSRVNAGANLTGIHAEDSIPIHYNPANPYQIDNNSSAYTSRVLFGSAVFIVIGVYLIRTSRHQGQKSLKSSNNIAS